MTSPKSSAGSKSFTAGCKDTRLQIYLNEECNREALQSSWIRRLHLRPTSHSPSPSPSPSPVAITTENPPPAMTLPTPTPTAVNSPSTTDSGFAMIGHLTDTSSHESRTPSSMLDANTTLFLHRLLKLRKEKPPLRADPESFSVSGFGPFQVQTRRVSSTDDVHLKDNEVMKDDANGGGETCGTEELDLARQDGSVAGMNDGWNFNYRRNSSSDACFPTMQTMTRFLVEEEEKQMEKISSLQQNLLPKNHRTLFTGKLLFSSESNFINNHNSSTRKPQEMLNVQKRRLSDEQHINTHSPFLRHWSSLKEHDYTKANPVTTLPRNGCLFDSSGEEAFNKFNNTNLDSWNLNHSWPVGGENKCSSSLKTFAAGAQRLSIRHFPANPRQPMTKASNEISNFSRRGGIPYHESCHDGVAGRSYEDSHPISQNAAPALHQHERHTPACSDETKNPSSFWKMDSFQRAEMVSSIFHACRSTGNKKRNSNADMFLSMKSRKLDPEG